MSLKKYIFLSLIAVIVLTGCLYNNSNVVRVDFDGAYVDADIADSKVEWEKGLMYRDGLNDTEGMFFVFLQEGYYSIWMKNMNFPIDIIWIDENLKVVHIEENVQPCTQESCPSYEPSKRAKYVLEVRANFTGDNNIEVGDSIHPNRSF